MDVSQVTRESFKNSIQLTIVHLYGCFTITRESIKNSIQLTIVHLYGCFMFHKLHERALRIVYS